MYALLLGTAQDAGVPQANCFRHDYCERVRLGRAPAPRVACLGLVDEEAGVRAMIDATPDFAAQLGELLAPAGAPLSEVAGATVPLEQHLAGIFLTHAHIGHYAGLLQLGKEAAAPHGLPLFVSRSMARFLAANAPWSGLLRAGHLQARVLEPGEPVVLGPSLQVEPFAVVHRAEYTDTFGYLVRGPERTLMYVPDADTWDGWPVPFETLLAHADVALLDGSFFSAAELPHRSQSEVPHPPVVQTLRRLQGLAERPPVRFVHLNHTNPLWFPDGPERRSLPAGFAVGHTGERLPL